MTGTRTGDVLSRRAMLGGMIGTSIVPLMPSSAGTLPHDGVDLRPRFGLVTYLWGSDLGLHSLLETCGAAGVNGIELRSTHAHGIEPTLTREERRTARALLSDGPVRLVGLGSDKRFDSPDPDVLASSIESTRRFLQLSHDLGGSGVKVKPDRFHPGVPRERTIDQIASALDRVGRTAEDLGQEIRLEVHGGCADPMVIRRIMEAVDSPAVKVCWNSNPTDLRGRGFDAHFDALRPSFGGTLHVRELDDSRYPYRLLVRRLVESGWTGWMLLEAHSRPGPLSDRVADLVRQRRLFESMLERARIDATQDALELRTRPTDDGVEILAGDDHLLSTCSTDRGPVLFPIRLPGLGQVVRGHPMAPRPDESTDHPHHRSLWLAHGDVDGHDFGDPTPSSLLSERVRTPAPEVVEIEWTAEWRASGRVKLVEDRVMIVTAATDRLRIDFDVTLSSPEGPVTFGDTKEGFFAVRLAPTLKVEGGDSARGRLENARGDTDGSAWGRRAPWIIAEGPLAGRLVRLRLTDHPDNPRHPTWWHARTYGLVAANPFGRRAFQGPDAESGSMTITAGKPLRLAYRLDIDAR